MSEEPKDYRSVTFADLINGFCVIAFLLWLMSHF